MLAATSRLLELVRDGSAYVHESDAWFEARACATVILRHGGKYDADAVLPVFLDDPCGAHELLPVLQWHGNADTGRRLYEELTGDEGLREDISASVFQAIGYLGYEPAAERLLLYAEQAMHHESRAACLGLLDLQCRGLEGRISALLRDIDTNALFPEFLLALAAKTGDAAFLDFIIKLGESASSDNVAGVMLGVAAFGEAGKTHFERFLTEPRWEADFAAAGTPFALKAGAFALGFKPTQIFTSLQKDFHAGLDVKVLRYRYSCLLELIESSDTGMEFRTDIPKSFDKPRESAAHILRTIFGDDCWDEDGIYNIAKTLQSTDAQCRLVEATDRIKNALDTALHRTALVRAMDAEKTG